MVSFWLVICTFSHYLTGKFFSSSTILACNKELENDFGVFGIAALSVYMYVRFMLLLIDYHRDNKMMNGSFMVIAVARSVLPGLWE